jgi:MYXO-CTERM domain-containing protein
MLSFHMHCAIAAVAIGCAMPAIASATTYDVAADFSASTNPNGAWSLGYSTTLGGAFNAYTANGTSGGVNFWQNAGGYPTAAHNPTAAAITSGTVTINAGQFAMHPGPGGEYAVARFTVQVTGMHTFSAAFVGQDFVFPTTTDVHLLLNSSPMFSSFINTFEGPGVASGIFSTTLNAGDTLDVAVGYGSNFGFTGDTTGVAFLVEAVPTPGAAALLGLGGLVAARRRRS